MFRERDKFVHLSENIKYGNLNKKYGNLPQIGNKGNNWTVFMVILSNKIIQNYHKTISKNG